MPTHKLCISFRLLVQIFYFNHFRTPRIKNKYIYFSSHPRSSVQDQNSTTRTTDLLNVKNFTQTGLKKNQNYTKKCKTFVKLQIVAKLCILFKYTLTVQFFI